MFLILKKKRTKKEINSIWWWRRILIMSSRYQNNKKKRLKDGRQVYRSKIYPKIPKRDNDIYIVTQGGDRLDTLTNQFYSDSSLWWIISHRTNNLHDLTICSFRWNNIKNTSR